MCGGNCNADQFCFKDKTCENKNTIKIECGDKVCSGLQLCHENKCVDSLEAWKYTPPPPLPIKLCKTMGLDTEELKFRMNVSADTPIEYFEDDFDCSLLNTFYCVGLDSNDAPSVTLFKAENDPRITNDTSCSIAPLSLS